MSTRNNNNNLNTIDGGEEKSNSLLSTPEGASRVPIKGMTQLKSTERSGGGPKILMVLEFLRHSFPYEISHNESVLFS